MSNTIESKLNVTRGKGLSSAPYETNNKEMLGIPVFSVYRADPAKNSATIDFKKNLRIYDQKDVDVFVMTCAKYMVWEIFRKQKTNTILVPASSSPLVSMVAKRIGEFDRTLTIVQDSFKKSEHTEIEIDTSIPGFTPAIGLVILNAIDKGKKTGHFELKNVSPPQFRKYVKGFMKMQSNVATKDITGKNVMILDDILTKGTTIVQCAKNLSGLAPLTLSAATIFKFS
jgi:hypothetical protein